MKETLKQFDKRIKKENAKENYNIRMQWRQYQKDHKGSPGKPYKSHRKASQIRKASTKVNKGEKFEKSKPWTKRIALALGRKYNGIKRRKNNE